MDVNPCLLAGEEEQSKLAVADDGWCHVWTVADGGMAALGSSASWLFNSRRKALNLQAHYMACFALPNVRAKRATTAGRQAPGWRKCTAYRQTWPGGLPLALRLSEGLGSTCHRGRLAGLIE